MGSTVKLPFSRWIPLLVCLLCGAAFYCLRPRKSATPQTPSVASSALLRSPWKSQAVVAGQHWLARGVKLQGSVIAPAREEGDVVTFTPDGKGLVGSIGNPTGRPLFYSWNARTGALTSTIGTALQTPSYRGGFFRSNGDFITVASHNVFRLNRQGRVVQAYFGKGTTRWLKCFDVLPGAREIVISMHSPFAQFNSPEVQKLPSLWRLNLDTGRYRQWFQPSSLMNTLVKMQWRNNVGCLFMDSYRIQLVDQRGVSKWSQKIMQEEPGGLGTLKNFYLSRDARDLWMLDSKSGVVLLDVNTKQQMRRFASSDFTKIMLSPDERFLLLSNAHGRLAIFNLRTSRMVRQVIFPFPTRNLAFSPDGKQLAVGGVVVVPFDV